MRPRRLLLTLAAMLFVAGFIFADLAQAQDVIIDGEATVTLTWEPPTEYENGDPLPPEDIAGYVIYYGTESRTDIAGDFRPGCADGPQGTRTDGSCYPNVVDLSDGSLTTVPISITVDQTTTFVFAAAAFVGAGSVQADEVSRYSNEAFKTVTLEIVTTAPGAPVIQSIDMTFTCETNLPNVSCTFTVEPD